VRGSAIITVGASAALGGLLYLLDLYPLYQTGQADPAPRWLRLTLFAAVCAAELFRRRAPAPSLVAVDCVFTPSIPTLIVLADLLYAAALFGSDRLRRLLVPAAAVSALLTLGVVVMAAPNGRTAVLICVVILPFVIVPVWWGPACGTTATPPPSLPGSASSTGGRRSPPSAPRWPATCTT
jgi:hypothetical protein